MLEWRLAEWLAVRQISLREFAELIEVSYQQASKLKTAKKMPEIGQDRLELICKALNVKAGDLLDRRNADTKTN